MTRNPNAYTVQTFSHRFGWITEKTDGTRSHALEMMRLHRIQEPRPTVSRVIAPNGTTVARIGSPLY